MMKFLRTVPKARLVLIFLWLLPLLWLGVRATSAFQGPDADVDFYVVPPEGSKPFTVGDRITLRLEVKHPSNTKVELPSVDEEWGAFDVVEQTATETVNKGDGTSVTGKNIIVSLFKPGQYETP